MNYVAQWQSTPIGNKILIIVSIVLYVLSLVIPFPAFEFHPGSLERLHFWQLITSVFVQGGFISFLINMTAIQDLSQAEKRTGSVLFIYEILVKNCIGMAMIYGVTRFYLLIFAVDYLGSSHFGLWNMGIYFITYKALRYPNEETQVLFLPFVIKTKFYALGILVLLNCFPFTQVTVLFFAQMAIMEHILFGRAMLRLNKGMIEKIENRLRFQSRQDFILIDHASEIIFQGTQRIEFQMENFQKQLDLSPNMYLCLFHFQSVSHSAEKVNTDDDSIQLK